jgi:hypothetical protein
MNPTLTIESLSETLAPNQTPLLDASEQTLQTEAGAARVTVALPVWKFGDLFEALMAMGSIVYMIGALGFGALLLFYTLKH